MNFANRRSHVEESSGVELFAFENSVADVGVQGKNHRGSAAIRTLILTI
jgi:hypothetical protein